VHNYIEVMCNVFLMTVKKRSAYLEFTSLKSASKVDHDHASVKSRA